MARSATELYSVPLKRKEFTVGDVSIPFKDGLLSTVTNIQKNIDNKTLRLVGPRLGAVTRNIDKLRNLLVAYSQCEWYEAKGEAIINHPVVLETYNKAVKEASVEDPTPSTETTATEGVAVKKTRVGTRPYCRSLIEDGELDETVLLAKVQEQYPDKPFKLGDVRGCLRNAGKLPWTARKGNKKGAA